MHQGAPSIQRWYELYIHLRPKSPIRTLVMQQRPIVRATPVVVTAVLPAASPVDSASVRRPKHLDRRGAFQWQISTVVRIGLAPHSVIGGKATARIGRLDVELGVDMGDGGGRRAAGRRVNVLHGATRRRRGTCGPLRRHIWTQARIGWSASSAARHGEHRRSICGRAHR